MKQSERWMWFWFDLLELLVEDYWICPYCGSTKVAECWETSNGRFRDGSSLININVGESITSWFCDNCYTNWDYWSSPLDCVDNWREWEYEGVIIK